MLQRVEVIEKRIADHSPGTSSSDFPPLAAPPYPTPERGSDRKLKAHGSAAEAPEVSPTDSPSFPGDEAPEVSP